MSAVALWPRRWRPVELVAQQRRIGRLAEENDRAVAVNAELLRQLREERDVVVALRDENVELRRGVVELRAMLRRLNEVVRSRGLVQLSPEMRAQIEAEGLAE